MEIHLQNLEKRIRKIEERLTKLPDPFIIMYKPPEGEDYVKLNEALDVLYDKINSLESSKE